MPILIYPIKPEGENVFVSKVSLTKEGVIFKSIPFVNHEI